MTNTEGGFKFTQLPDGWSVSYRGRELGTIHPCKESNGRHCFTLGFDQSKNPRTYRGRLQSAEALKLIDSLKRDAAKRRWPLEVLITRAWATKPQTVAQ